VPLSNNEKQAAFRKRNAELGRSELRGIFATDKEKVVLKSEIKKILERRRKAS